LQKGKGAESRVARWFVFKPKIPIWVNFGEPWNGKRWHILWSFGIFYGHFGIFYGHLYLVIWYIFPRFGILCQEKSGSPG
jgi:hypothetical protein